MQRSAKASISFDLSFDSDMWGIDFESMSDEEFTDFVRSEFLYIVSVADHSEIEVELD